MGTTESGAEWLDGPGSESDDAVEVGKTESGAEWLGGPGSESDDAAEVGKTESGAERLDGAGSESDDAVEVGKTESGAELPCIYWSTLGSGRELSVTLEGKQLSSSKASLLNGHTPGTLKPEMMLFGVLAFRHASRIKSAMPYIDMALPGLDKHHALHAEFM